MPAKVKVDLINPTTDAIVESVSADGILPDVHKYISTFGFPYIEKTSAGSSLFWNTAFIYQGIMCNSEKVDGSKSKCMFKPCIDVTARGNYCTDAFTVTASNTTYKMGDLDKRYGYYNNTLSGNTLDKCVKVWEWDQNNGNGNINSICLTNSPAAITYNKDFPEEIVALPATATYPLSGITRYTYFPTAFPQIDSTNNLANNSGDWIQALINVDLPTSDKIACYQTTKNIVFLKALDADYTYNGTTYPAKRNEQQADGTYITRIYYKVVDKKWLFKYRQGIFGSENTGDDTDVYHPLATYLSSQIVANSDGYIDINTGTSQVKDDSFFFNVEDNAYAILGVSYGSRGQDAPKDYDAKVNTSYFFKSRYYVISGDTSNKVEVTFLKGIYKIDNLKIYYMDYNDIKDINKKVTKVDIDSKTKGDKIYASVETKKDGYFVTTLPYDKGFTIKVDNKKIDYEKVNTAYVGFKISKGNHNIVIEYNSPFKTLGLIMSLAGIIVYILFYHKNLIKYIKKK